MDTSENPPAQTCNSIETRQAFDAAFRLFGDFCTLRALETIGHAELRFTEIQRALEINPVTLTSRLKKLEESGLISRKSETLDKQSVVYSLTAKGRDCMPVIQAIKTFTTSHM